MIDLSEISLDGYCNFCFYDTETEMFLCIDTEDDCKVEWASTGLFEKYELYMFTCTINTTIEEIISTNKYLFELEAFHRITQRREHILFVPIDLNGKPRFDLI